MAAGPGISDDARYIAAQLASREIPTPDFRLVQRPISVYPPAIGLAPLPLSVAEKRGIVAEIKNRLTPGQGSLNLKGYMEWQTSNYRKFTPFGLNLEPGESVWSLTLEFWVSVPGLRFRSGSTPRVSIPFHACVDGLVVSTSRSVDGCLAKLRARV